MEEDTMRTKLGAGILAGLIAGVIFGIMMTMMTTPTPDGGRMPMMEMVAQVVRSDSLAVGWVYHLFNSALIGAIFGWVLGSGGLGYGGALAKGIGYGIFWWILGGQILMPLFLGMEPFAALQMAPMRSVALMSLVGHVIFGGILGLAYAGLRGGEPVRREQPASIH
jgi:hypothetical protein